jgi:hypothetical protein
MAFRISENVVCGELFNTRKNSVHGWLGLRGFRRPLTLDLTGNPSDDLVGKHIRFKLRGLPDDDDEPESDDPPEAEKARLEQAGLAGLAWQQIGPTGVITAARRVRAPDCSIEELLLRCKLGEPPPTPWKPCLTIEWFSQNGRVLVELVDPEIEFVNEDAKESPAGAKTAEHEPSDDAPQSSDDAASLDSEYDPDVASDPFEDLDEFDLPDLSVAGNQDAADDDQGADVRFDADGECDEDECDECGESWNVVPKDLQRELDAQSRELDRALRSDEENEVVRELELMDDLIENGDGEPLGTLFDEVVKLPSPDSLDEAGAEETLKILLAKLALYGIAFDMCPHFNARDAYRLLVEEFCQEECAYRELRGTQWVQHFSTYEHCPQCEAQFDREYEEYKAEHPDEHPPPEQGDRPEDKTGGPGRDNNDGNLGSDESPEP